MAFFMALFKPLAYLSLPFIILRSLSQSSPTARYYIRSAAYAGTMATVASVSIVVGVTYNILGKKHDTNHWVARLFYESASRIFNVKVEVEGEELLDNRPAVLMGNHQSFIDILILGRIFPKQASIISKKSLLFTPLGPFMTLSGAVFIDRGNNSKAVKSLNDASSLIKRLKISIWMFPEGTRHLEAKSDMLPLKKGGFHLAINAGIPIIPVVAENYYDLYHNGVFNEGVIKVKVLPPIPTVGLTTADAGDLAIRVREEMVQALREISRKSADELIEEAKAKVVAQEQVIVAPAPPETEKSLPTSPSSEISGLSAADFGSSASLASSVASESIHSKSGTETDEDEGMILVNRPDSP